jgi:hypothetical protein
MKPTGPFIALAALVFSLAPHPTSTAETNVELICARLAERISKREDLTQVVKRELLEVVKRDCVKVFSEPPVPTETR